MKRRYLAGVLISAVFLYLAFRKAHLSEVVSALRSADYAYFAPAAALILLSLFLRAVRWRYLLNPIKPVGMRSLFAATAIGSMGNYLLPARIGELIRAHVIGEKEKISRGASFATIVVERVFDGFTLLLFLAVILLLGTPLPGWLRDATTAAVVFYIVALGGLIAFTVKTELVLRVGAALVRPLPDKIGGLLMRVLDRFGGGLRILKSSKDIVLTSLLSPLVWVPNAIMIQLLFMSFGIQVPAAISFLLLVALCIGIMIPSAPGFIGTIQYVSVAVLALFGVPRGQALSFSIVYHLGVFVPIVGAGLVSLVMEGVSFRELNIAAKPEE